jgi:hypothetical protein
MLCASWRSCDAEGGRSRRHPSDRREMQVISASRLIDDDSSIAYFAPP